MIGGSKNIIKDRANWYDTFQENAFMGGGYRVAGGGTYGHVQLWNPAASGKLLYVTKIFGYGSAPLYFADHNVAFVGAGYTPLNKLISSVVAAVATLPWGDNAVLQGTTRGLLPVTLTLELYPILVIPEGHGIHLSAGALAGTTGVVYEWTEVPV